MVVVRTRYLDTQVPVVSMDTSYRPQFPKVGCCNS